MGEKVMKVAVFAGTFDPPHLGHLDIITRSVSVCETLIVGVGRNRAKEKKNTFSQEERVAMLRRMTQEIPHVQVHAFEGLVVDFAKQVEAAFLVRGLRAYSDWEYEFMMALANRKMGGIETTFLMAASNFAHISSSLIKEVGGWGQRLGDFVPESLEEQVFQRLSTLH